MSLFKKFVNQTRKPEGFLGKLMVGGRNASGRKQDIFFLPAGRDRPVRI